MLENTKCPYCDEPVKIAECHECKEEILKMKRDMWQEIEEDDKPIRTFTNS